MIATADPPKKNRRRTAIRYKAIGAGTQDHFEIEDAQSAAARRMVVKTDDIELLIEGPICVDVSIENTTTEVDDTEDEQIELFLEKVYVLSESKRDRFALDEVFQRINRLLVNGNAALCDRMLSAVNVERCSSTVLVGFLSITLDSKDELLERPAYYKRVFEAIREERGPDATARLLTKYK